MKIRPCSSENYKKSDCIRRRHTVTGGFDKIVFATDQDLDGFHIRGLLLGFIEKYLPHLKDKVFMLQTPVVVIMKNSKPERWAYDLNTDLAPKTKESMDYKKGLGSWDPEDLKFIINKDGLDQMIVGVTFDNMNLLDDRLGVDSEPRKKYIVENEFNIAKI